MLRRSHKKSKTGCRECKKRHVKCDENKPVCLLCSVSDRKCSYAYEDQVPDARARRSPYGTRPTASTQVAAATPTTPASNPESPDTPSSSATPSAPAIAAVVAGELNLTHMELLIHITVERSMFDLGITIGAFQENVSLALKLGLKYPYVLHQILAFSARHLAYMKPELAEFYLHQAVTLQTTGVSLFNAVSGEVNQSNCEAVLLFSTFLAHQVLAETLSQREPRTLQAFLTQYIQCAEMHRGVFVIAKNSWPFLRESKLWPILEQSSRFTARDPVGDHCQMAYQLLNFSETLSDAEQTTCKEVLDRLQVGFDAMLAAYEPPEERGNRHRMISSWPIIVPPEYVRLLAQKNPEALVILAYYAALLNYGKRLWQVGDAGQYVFGLIVEYLDNEWHAWLKHPGDLIEKHNNDVRNRYP